MPNEGTPGGPLLRLSKTGVQEAEFDMSGAVGFNVFAVRPKGGIATVQDERGYSVVNLGPDGRRESAVHLDAARFFPFQLAVFPSGEILLAGIQRGTRESPHSNKVFTALYDARGHLVKQLSLDQDPEIERPNESGDVRYVGATTGEDGNVYLMRRASPATVYVISSTGEVVRKLVIAPPSAGQTPGAMQASKNKLAVLFYNECTARTCKGASYTVVDTVTGEKLADYVAGGDVGGAFACYAPDPDRFFFLQMSGEHRLEILEARPR